MGILPRKLSLKLLELLDIYPIVFINGPRQAGKSTLVQTVNQTQYKADYVTFDNVSQTAAASATPTAFLKGHEYGLIIDEVQRVPEIFLPLKALVDEYRTKDKLHANGRFLLTGSTNILALPKLSDSLVGRMGALTLYPFSVTECLSGKGDFLDRLFTQEFTGIHNKLSLMDAIFLATFPEISGKPWNVCSLWLEGYLTTLLQREIHLLTEIEKVALLPVLLRLLAGRAGGLMNDADISRDTGINPVTGKRYRLLLQMLFLTFDVQPWFKNIAKRLIKSPKGYLVDTLLLCHLLDWQPEALPQRRPELFGHVLENFIATELLKLLSFNNSRIKLMHFRTHDGKEVDFVLEKPDGTLAGIEVKSSEIIHLKDFKGLQELQEHVPENFAIGIVLYSGTEVIPFGKDLWAVPFAILWQ